jgi:Xaa-Pro aminopeptidase
MQHIDERWMLFIDFAATFHESLADVKLELEVYARSDHTTAAELAEKVSKIEKHWKTIRTSLDTFTRTSEVMLRDPQLTPQQTRLTTEIIQKIREAATMTDASLRVFFEQTHLVQYMSSREMSGETLKKIQ